MVLQPAGSALLHNLTIAAFALHIGGGTVGLISGTVALFAAKGGPLHRRAGNIFFVSMLVMAAFAVYLGFAMPGQIPNVFGGLFAFYLVATAWMTVQRAERTIGWQEKIAAVVVAILFLPFALLIFELWAGLPTFVSSATPLTGPVFVAVNVFTVVIGIAAVSDARLVFAGGIAGAARIARHLWRMCLGLTLAAGSGFTNGVARLVPHAWHVPFFLYFIPQFIPLAFLVFWMIRVRLTGWFKQGAPAAMSAAR